MIRFFSIPLPILSRFKNCIIRLRKITILSLVRIQKTNSDMTFLFWKDNRGSGSKLNTGNHIFCIQLLCIKISSPIKFTCHATSDIFLNQCGSDGVSDIFFTLKIFCLGMHANN